MQNFFFYYKGEEYFNCTLESFIRFILQKSTYSFKKVKVYKNEIPANLIENYSENFQKENNFCYNGTSKLFCESIVYLNFGGQEMKEVVDKYDL